MKKLFAIAVLSALLPGPAAAAELSQRYAGWAEGPEGHLLIKEERKAWSSVRDDEAAARFIELFWARRDPDLATPKNEVHEEFERRVAYADERFGTDRRRGALTDRGKVVILLGMPLRASRTEPGQTVRPLGGGAGAESAGSLVTDDIQTRVELWEYRADQLPVSVRGPRLTVGFYEERLNKNDFVLDRSLEGSTVVLRALARASETMIRHPDLVEVPASYATAAGASSPAAAAPAHLAWLDAGAPARPQGSALLTDLGVAPDGERPLWVHVELPRSARALELLAGRLTGADGAVLGTFEVPAEPIPLDAGTAYHVAVPLPPGATTLEIAGGADGTPVFVEELRLAAAPQPDDRAWLSRPLIGRRVTREPRARPGDPFNFGGWHVIPNPAGRLTKGQDVPYFGFAAVAGGGQPDLTASIHLYHGAQKVAGPLTVDLTPAKVAEGLWMYGDALKLTNLPEGGYRLELTIADEASGTTVRRDVELRIVPPSE